VTEDKVYEAVAVGARPNGLVVAVELARGGRSVVMLETPRDHRRRQDMSQAPQAPQAPQAQV